MYEVKQKIRKNQLKLDPGAVIGGNEFSQEEIKNLLANGSLVDLNPPPPPPVIEEPKPVIEEKLPTLAPEGEIIPPAGAKRVIKKAK